ncbi:MAG: type II secretion system F family protein [Pseudomonadota bacterium]
MFGLDLTLLAFIGLAALAAGGIGYGLLYNRIASEQKTSKRVKSIRSTRASAKGGGGGKNDAAQRRKSIEDTLKNAEIQSGKDSKNPPLAVKLQQAGLSITPSQFYIGGAVLGVLVALGCLIGGFPIYAVGGMALFMGAGFPMWLLGFLRKRRELKFIEEFPNSVDVIVRGIKAGLPLNDCIRIIAGEAKEPVRGEFQRIVEAQQLGLTIPEAVERLYKSVPTSETNFFSIVISIQSQAGGNLSEALGNLSRVLRERRKMKDKIIAMSTEAKASGVIIGALPIVVAGLVYITSPDYISLLFFDETGHLILGACAVWMGVGIFVMKSMINFDF